MIFGVLKGIVAFTIILVIIVVGFALGFFVLFTSEAHDVAGQSHVGMSLLSAFIMIFGEFEVSEYEASTSYYVCIGLFVAFMYLVNVVLLNLLIAIMGDIYDQIQENARAQFLFSKARLILEFEEVTKPDKNLSDRDLNEHFPVWLQILEPTKAKADNGIEIWTGRVRSLKLAISRAAQQTTNIITSVHDMVSDIFDMTKLNSNEVTEVKEAVGELRMVLLQLLKENCHVKETLEAIRQENKELRGLIGGEHHTRKHHHSKRGLEILPPPIQPIGRTPSKGTPSKGTHPVKRSPHKKKTDTNM